MALVEFAILAITSLIAITEPFSTTAIYLTLTKGMDEKRKRKIISKSMIISALVLVFFAVTGNLLFSFLGITVSAFEIAGGLLLITVAIKMLYPQKEDQSSNGMGDIAVMPLAIPLTAGPGTITAVILLASEAQGLIEIPFIYIGIFAAVAISYITMRYSNRLLRILGDDGLRVIAALMAILILAIAVQFIITGIDGAIKQFL